MAKKVFLVNVEPASFEMYVYAEDAREARAVAAKHAAEEYDNLDDDYHCSSGQEVSSLSQVPECWRSGIPYGEDFKSVAELLPEKGPTNA